MTGFEPNVRLGVWLWSVCTIAELGLLVGLGVEAKKRRDLRSVGRLAAPFAVERAVVHGIGPLVDRDRPRSRLRRPGFLSPSSSSMPSGHASNSFLAATLLSATRRTWLVFALAAVASGSRVALRVHRITEVAASAVVGVGLGLAMNRWLAPEDDGPETVGPDRPVYPSST